MHICVWMTIAIYLWSTIKLAERMGDPSKTLLSSNSALAHTKSDVCICLADSRYSTRDMMLADISSFEELRGIINQDPQPIDEWGYWRKTALINTAYALRFNYKVIVSDLSAYQSVFNTTRSAVWLKPAFMLDMQYKRPDCQWFAMMDSDAYFWMANHTVALPDWFATKSLHEATARYHHHEEEKRIRRGYYDWNDFDAFLLIGMNGVFLNRTKASRTFMVGRSTTLCARAYISSEIVTPVSSSYMTGCMVLSTVQMRNEHFWLNMRTNFLSSNACLMLFCILATRTRYTSIPLKTLRRYMVPGSGTFGASLET